MSKEQIDAVLGITDGQSIDDFLDGLGSDTASLSSTFQTIDSGVKGAVEKIDESFKQVQAQPDSSASILAIKDIDLSLKEVEELIDLSKKLFKHIYQNVITSDLIDSEVVGATAKLLESIHINIAEFLSVYKDKQKFYDKIRVMVFQQDQKKELMMLKHKLDMEKAAAKLDDGAIDAETTSVYNQEDIVKLLADADKA